MLSTFERWCSAAPPCSRPPMSSIALVARRGMQDGFRPWEKSLLAALWILPFIARPASIYHLPITPILLGLVLAFFARPPASASQTVAAPQPAASLSA